MTEFEPLAGKICLVTGATRGIGKGIALQLGQAGATVYITGKLCYHSIFTYRIRSMEKVMMFSQGSLILSTPGGGESAFGGRWGLPLEGGGVCLGGGGGLPLEEGLHRWSRHPLEIRSTHWNAFLFRKCCISFFHFNDSPLNVLNSKTCHPNMSEI